MRTALLLFFGGVLYCLPAFIGAEKRNRVAIISLNLLLGWTIIGWVIALIWALTKDPTSSVAVQESDNYEARRAALQQKAAAYEAPTSLPADPEARAVRLKDLRDRGVITQQEFMEQIAKL